MRNEVMHQKVFCTPKYISKVMFISFEIMCRKTTPARHHRQDCRIGVILSTFTIPLVLAAIQSKFHGSESRRLMFPKFSAWIPKLALSGCGYNETKVYVKYTWRDVQPAKKVSATHFFETDPQDAWYR